MLFSFYIKDRPQTLVDCSKVAFGAGVLCIRKAPLSLFFSRTLDDLQDSVPSVACLSGKTG